LSDKDALREELVPLSNYLIFEDQQDYPGKGAEFFKEKAIENYPRVQSYYQREVKRICSFYSQRQEAGYVFEYTTATFIPSENQGNLGYMVLRYSSRIENEIIND